MITDLTLQDTTQKQILKHLEETDQLLAAVSSRLSHTEKESHIYAMPDLGIPHNATRVLGGFYTGACYTWDSDVPFVAIDSTVNVCGTGVYRLKYSISNEDFQKRVTHVFEHNINYIWNYDKGNHFVILAYSDGSHGLPEGQYLVLHASALEYKNDLEKGLYPVKGNWYYHDIQIEKSKTSNRYLRYISGKKAERFYEIAAILKEFNIKRNLEFARLVLGDLLEEELLNVSHYGIPTMNSVCIGCQWENRPYTLLTSPGNNIYLVNPVLDKTSSNYSVHNNTELLLSAHGLGLEFKNPDCTLQYHKNRFEIGEKEFAIGDSIKIDVYTKVRNYNSSTINTILQKCPGDIYGELQQLCSINKDGFKEFKKAMPLSI